MFLLPNWSCIVLKCIRRALLRDDYPIDYIYLPASDIWHPSLGTFQMKSGSDPSFQMEERRAKIKSNGLVSITFSTMSASICGPSLGSDSEIIFHIKYRLSYSSLSSEKV